MTLYPQLPWVILLFAITSLSVSPSQAQRFMDNTGAYQGTVQDGRFYNRSGSYIGRDDGRMFVYDASGSMLGRFDGKMVYDHDGSFMGRVDGGRIYGRDGSYLGRIDGGRLYGRDGSYQGRTDAVRERDLLVWWWFYRNT